MGICFNEKNKNNSAKNSLIYDDNDNSSTSINLKSEKINSW